jgi:Na+-transporting NADH:ubiquinone oxidoreductase subunit NqrB
MREKLVLNNTNIIYGNIEETNINNVNISSKNTGSVPATLKIVANAENKFLHNLHIILSGKSDFRLLSSIFHYSVIVIEEIVLLVLLIGYFIIGATTVILYVIFYEKIYKSFLISGEKRNIILPVITS